MVVIHRDTQGGKPLASVTLAEGGHRAGSTPFLGDRYAQFDGVVMVRGAEPVLGLQGGQGEAILRAEVFTQVKPASASKTQVSAPRVDSLSKSRVSLLFSGDFPFHFLFNFTY